MSHEKPQLEPNRLTFIFRRRTKFVSEERTAATGVDNIARIWLKLREFKIRSSQGFSNSPKSHANTISRKSHFPKKYFAQFRRIYAQVSKSEQIMFQLNRDF